ncbi:MAG: hypothetical protein ACKO8Z_04465 [Prosthecobacter sp.]
MKTSFLRACVPSMAAILTMTVFLAISRELPAADDLDSVYQKGREAFHKGDFVTAHAFLTQVAAAKPGHADTQNMLRYLQAHAKQQFILKRDYAAVTVPKIDMQDVTLEEAVSGLRVLAKNASQGKISPNLIIKSTSLAEKKLSLTLGNVPLTQAIEYLAQLSGAKVTYDKHAVIFSEVSAAGPEAKEVAK